MSTATAMIDPAVLAGLRSDLAEANRRVAALRGDTMLSARMVDSLMLQRDDLAAALAAAQADAALWRQRVMDTREILNLVEDVADDPSPANVAALTDAFQAWRMLVERGVPVAWGVAGETGDGAPDAGVEYPF